jgi:creatinine amidohydrolase
MLWAEVTSERFPAAVEAAGGVCVVPMGCLERHGPHLPLGTDQIVIDEVVRRAEEEPAVVFPSYYLGQIAEARHCPGAFSLPHELLLRLLCATFEEIGRNGFSKIIVASGHGGNSGLIGYALATMLQERRDYCVYALSPDYRFTDEERAQFEKLRKTDGKHAGETETSTILALRPELVHLEDITDPDAWKPQGLQAHLRGVRSPFGWYAEYPTHYAGDARPATSELGEFLIGVAVRRIAEAIRAVKADTATPAMQREFHDRADHGGRD